MGGYRSHWHDNSAMVTGYVYSSAHVPPPSESLGSLLLPCGPGARRLAMHIFRSFVSLSYVAPQRCSLLDSVR